jgi:hypothetical protein
MGERQSDRPYDRLNRGNTWGPQITEAVNAVASGWDHGNVWPLHDLGEANPLCSLGETEWPTQKGGAGPSVVSVQHVGEIASRKGSVLDSVFFQCRRIGASFAPEGLQ